jgi:hypothetical protein
MFTSNLCGHVSRLGYYIAVQTFTHTSHLSTRKLWARHARVCRISLAGEWSRQSHGTSEKFLRKGCEGEGTG